MSRVVVKRTDSSLEEASLSCPVGAFKKSGEEFVIDPNLCIDCGVCQSVVEEGVILEDGEADAEDVSYNENKTKE
jgi:NAD-dependent dihydropyrimidine dehydrogenase PreA subunit